MRTEGRGGADSGGRQRGAAAPRSGPAPPGATPPKLCAGKRAAGNARMGPAEPRTGRESPGAAEGAAAAVKRGELGSHVPLAALTVLQKPMELSRYLSLKKKKNLF